MMKSEKYQNEYKVGRLNKKGKKEKGNMKFHRNKNMIRGRRNRKLQQRKITLKAIEMRSTGARKKKK